MIMWIVLSVVWIISTEFIFFTFAKDEDVFGESFMSKKFASLITGLLITFLIAGVPTILAFAPRAGDLESFGIIAYAWYYGIISAFIIFFGINYILYKLTKRNGDSK